MNPQEPTREELALLPAAARVAFGLICAEHLLPSLELQIEACRGSLPAGLSLARYQSCLDMLWGWLAAADGPPPTCITEQDADTAEGEIEGPDQEAGTAEGEIEGPAGLWYLVSDAFVALWYARSSYDRPTDCGSAGRRVFATLYWMVEELLGPQPRDEDLHKEAELNARRQAAKDAHGMVRLARTAQQEAFEALTAGVPTGALREPARAVGQQIASWTAPLLERLIREDEGYIPPMYER